MVGRLVPLSGAKPTCADTARMPANGPNSEHWPGSHRDWSQVTMKVVSLDQTVLFLSASLNHHRNSFGPPGVCFQLTFPALEPSQPRSPSYRSKLNT
jgi:hypothetical protein